VRARMHAAPCCVHASALLRGIYSLHATSAACPQVHGQPAAPHQAAQRPHLQWRVEDVQARPTLDPCPPFAPGVCKVLITTPVQLRNTTQVEAMGHGNGRVRLHHAGARANVHEFAHERNGLVLCCAALVGRRCSTPCIQCLTRTHALLCLRPTAAPRRCRRCSLSGRGSTPPSPRRCASGQRSWGPSGCRD